MGEDDTCELIVGKLDDKVFDDHYMQYCQLSKRMYERLFKEKMANKSVYLAISKKLPGGANGRTSRKVLRQVLVDRDAGAGDVRKIKLNTMTRRILNVSTTTKVIVEPMLDVDYVPTVDSMLLLPLAEPKRNVSHQTAY